jgi:hypothetical protein
MFPKVVAMLPAANTKLPSKVFLNPRLNPNLTDNGKKLTNLLSERMENCVKNDSDFAFADDAATCDILLGFSVCYGKETFVNVVFPSRVEEIVKAMKLGDNVAYSELSDSINSVIPFVNLEVVVKNNTKKEEIESYLSSLARGVFDCL